MTLRLSFSAAKTSLQATAKNLNQFRGNVDASEWQKGKTNSNCYISNNIVLLIISRLRKQGWYGTKSTSLIGRLHSSKQKVRLQIWCIPQIMTLKQSQLVFLKDIQPSIDNHTSLTHRSRPTVINRCQHTYLHIARHSASLYSYWLCTARHLASIKENKKKHTTTMLSLQKCSYIKQQKCWNYRNQGFNMSIKKNVCLQNKSDIAVNI